LGGGNVKLEPLLFSIATAAVIVGCATTPTDVRTGQPVAAFVMPGKASSVAECAAVALEEDTGMETTRRGTELAMWGGLERKTIAVLTLADSAEGVRGAVYLNQHMLFADGKTITDKIEAAARRCKGAS
jgi:hypothetical protein